jgi:uncharacterized protein YjbJ (UPF0337 family)
MRDETHSDGTRTKMQGHWEEIRGRVKEKWGQLTDDELDQVEGKRDILVGKIHQRYGGVREDIDRELDHMWPAA